MRSAAWFRLGLKVYAFVFIAILVYLNFKEFLEVVVVSQPKSSGERTTGLFIILLVPPIAALWFIVEAQFYWCASVVYDEALLKCVSWLIFVVSAECLWRFLARLLVSWWQLLVDVFDVDRWWDAASQGTVFFGSFFAYCLFTVALRSIELEGVEARELAQLRRERRQVDADQNAV